MDLKNAAAVCLISLFAATLVVLIARFLDAQAAARLEPHLARIVEELEAIRAGGGVAVSGEEATSAAADDALMVYYFHGVRCPTCRAAESITHDTLTTEYASELARGEVVWRVLDYLNDPQAESLAVDFEVNNATVVLARMKDGQMDRWNRLDRVLALADDPAALAAHVEAEIDAMLHPSEAKKADEAEAEALPVPLP